MPNMSILSYNEDKYLKKLKLLKELMSFPKYKYLLTYRYAEIIFDLNTEFIEKYFHYTDPIPPRRTIDQMFQAGRSGKQNIIEGVGQGRTSKKGEIKLLGVSNSSFEELLADYEDFLRKRNMPIYVKGDKQVMESQRYGYRLSNISNLSDSGFLKEKPVLPDNPEKAANLMLTLLHIVTYLLSRQIDKAEQDFVEHGGYTENLFKKRLKNKI